MSERKRGFYWIKLLPSFNPEVAYWTGDCDQASRWKPNSWYVVGIEKPVEDEDWIEIMSDNL